MHGKFLCLLLKMNLRLAIILVFNILLLFLAYQTSFHLVILTVLFFTSLLNVFKSPTSELWKLSIFTTEYSIIFVALTVVLLLTSFIVASATFVSTLLGIAAIVLYLSPIVQAFFIAEHLPAELKKAFQSINNGKVVKDLALNKQAFRFAKLFQLVKKVSYETVTYVTYDDKTLTLDFYRSTAVGKRPCILVIHGGSWSQGNNKQLPELNSHLARAGYHCAAINYRLAPKWKCPAPIDDTVAALNYLRQHADRFDIDINQFVLLGRSAGGQIALLTAYTHQELGIKGVVDFYGPADMIWGYKNPTNPLVMNSNAILSRYIGGNYEEMPDKYAASSPIEFVNEKTVPTLMFHGDTDSLVYSAHHTRLSEKLRGCGVPHYFLQLPWATHGFDYNLNGPGGQLSTYAIDYFLDVVTNLE